MMRLVFFVLMFYAGWAHGQGDEESIQVEDREYESSESVASDMQDPSKLPATREYASQKIEVRKFDQKKWREIIDARNYTDTRTRKSPPNQETMRDDTSDQGSGSRAREEDSEGSDYDYSDSGESSGTDLGWLGSIGPMIFYVAIAAIIGAILVQIVRNTSLGSSPKRPPTVGGNAETIHDISQLDTENMIQKAHNARDYKLAIRLYFLDLLKSLNENGMIDWTKDKTNRDYLSELFSKQFYFNEIRQLTHAYERVWYGEHTPTEERYEALRKEFMVISQKFKES